LDGGEPGAAPPLPDLTGVPLEEILRGPDTALARAARRVLLQTAGGQPPIAAYDAVGSGEGVAADEPFTPPGDGG
jgi:FXSXX-COOH protein